MQSSHPQKHARRARVFELAHQGSQAETTSARIRQSAANKCSDQEVEKFRTMAARSLKPDQPNLPVETRR